MSDCIFCKIINNELPSHKLYEDDDVLAFMDIQPINDGHLLIIPKKHAELISEVDDYIFGKMHVVGKKINSALRDSGLNVEGVNFFIADGEAAGQEVFHVHLHLIPRFKDDAFGFKFPDDYEIMPSQEELKKAADSIRAVLK